MALLRLGHLYLGKPHYLPVSMELEAAICQGCHPPPAWSLCVPCGSLPSCRECHYKTWGRGWAIRPSYVLKCFPLPQSLRGPANTELGPRGEPEFASGQGQCIASAGGPAWRKMQCRNRACWGAGGRVTSRAQGVQRRWRWNVKGHRCQPGNF